MAVELARRDVEVVGVDLDEDLLDRARAKAPDLTWVLADLAGLDLSRAEATRAVLETANPGTWDQAHARAPSAG